MHAATRIFAALLVAVLFALLGGCQKRTPSDAAPVVIPRNFKVGVAWFTQPTTTSALLTGQLPTHQKIISPGRLTELDGALARVFAQESSRPHIVLPAQISMPSINLHESGSPQGLRTWLEVGREANVDILFVPQIIHWQELGTDGGGTHGAAIKAEFHLLDVARGRIVRHYVFDEEQVGLASNLLTVDKFFKRKARWLTAVELTQEGMREAVKDFGL
ncbi:MAG: hypothetical protein LBH94_02705 [Deltaproteobacteria bacterium]|jgi:hypothetical protein|nr:hypothetical protein [Deltaproteobacteria bacterium]